MDNIFFVAAVISVVFLIAKFIEMRFVEKENKPLKFLIRDSLLVYISVIIGSFILDQLKPVMNEIVVSEVPLAFTDNPSF